ncbi:MAG: uncharacterized protein A8A55_0841 [Amphiamblys sp. WSBS2006]|nr:MAG: uncharacterized protein A8A55_0841 [Amphiamblys sp. WSBS2006]
MPRELIVCFSDEAVAKDIKEHSGTVSNIPAAERVVLRKHAVCVFAGLVFPGKTTAVCLEKVHTGLFLSLLVRDVCETTLSVFLFESIRIDEMSADCVLKRKTHGNTNGTVRIKISGTEATETIKGLENKSVHIGRPETIEIRGCLSAFPKLNTSGETVGTVKLTTDDPEQLRDFTSSAGGFDLLGETTERLVLEKYAVNILQSLQLKKEAAIHSLELSADSKEHVEEILSGKHKKIYVGYVRRIELTGYSLNILSVLETNGQNCVDEMTLSAHKKEEVEEILDAGDRTLFFGGIKHINMKGYGIGCLPKIKIPKNNTLSVLSLQAWSEEETEEITKHRVDVGCVENIFLNRHGVSVLPFLDIERGNTLCELKMNATDQSQVLGIIGCPKESILMGKVKKISLSGYAANVLPKLKTEPGNKIDRMALYTDTRDQTSEINNSNNEGVFAGDVGVLELKNCDMDLLKLKLSNSRKIKSILIWCEEKNKEKIADGLWESDDCREKTTWMGSLKTKEDRRTNIMFVFSYYDGEEMIKL